MTFIDDGMHAEYVGCFKDEPASRVLDGHFYKFKNNNSPVYCVNMCLRAGYKYAGLYFLFHTLFVSFKLFNFHNLQHIYFLFSELLTCQEFIFNPFIVAVISGIEYRDECFCGDTLGVVISLPENACRQYVCDNESLFCGGYNALAVYMTGILGKSVKFNVYFNLV